MWVKGGFLPSMSRIACLLGKRAHNLSSGYYQHPLAQLLFPCESNIFLRFWELHTTGFVTLIQIKAQYLH